MALQGRRKLESYQTSGFSFLLFRALSQNAVGSWHLRISKIVVFTSLLAYWPLEHLEEAEGRQ